MDTFLVDSMFIVAFIVFVFGIFFIVQYLMPFLVLRTGCFT